MPDPQRSNSNSRGFTSTIFGALVLVVLMFVGIIYLITGNDSMQLFGSQASPSAPTATQPAQETSAASPVNLPSPTPFSAIGWRQVYFTDPNGINNPFHMQGSIEEDLIQRIQQAKSTIDIAAFEFDLTPIAQALIEAKKRGVSVRWVTDDENGLEVDSEPEHGQFAMLQKAKIPVKADASKNLMHNKFIIFDGEVVWTGATNLTINGIFHNNNNALVIRSIKVAAIYERVFNDLWAGRFDANAPSYANQQSLSIDGTPIQIYFSPQDHIASRLIPLLDGAQSSIRFMAFSFTHDGMAQAMIKRAKAGVSVSGIFESRGSDNKESELDTFFCAEVPVRTDGNSSTFHHKVIIIDEQTVITGSFNFSRNADENNNENIVILRDAALAREFLREFDARWAEGYNASSAKITCP